MRMEAGWKGEGRWRECGWIRELRWREGGKERGVGLNMEKRAEIEGGWKRGKIEEGWRRERRWRRVWTKERKWRKGGEKAEI